MDRESGGEECSFFFDVPEAPPDSIFGVTEAFKLDSNPDKVNLGVGAYHNDQGVVPVLNSVRKAEELLLSRETSKAYLKIDGDAEFIHCVRALVFGKDFPCVKEERIATVETVGGTGALRIGADFVKRYFPEAAVWHSAPTWGNHRGVFSTAGFALHEYPYYDPKTHGVDFNGVLSALSSMPKQSVVLLHVCCHNPTGVDFSKPQWDEVIEVLLARELIPFLDFAYQGFADGIEQDAYPVRQLALRGGNFLLASSFSKNASLYRERVGTLSVVCGSAVEAKSVTSQLKDVIRTNYSNPPAHGALTVATILSDDTLRAEWEAEVCEMRERIQWIRENFVKRLQEQEVPFDFNHVLAQRGMFSYSGLSKEHVQKLRSERSVYILDNGRICLAAINRNNLEYVCDAIANVLF